MDINMEIKVDIIDERSDYVIFLHGITEDYKIMQKIADGFLEKNYNTVLISYPSTKYPLKDLIPMVRSMILDDIGGKVENKKIHFIGHSMGGLIIRGLIKYPQIKSHLGSVVMLGTPNHGSSLSDLIGNFSLYKNVFGPAGQDLKSNQAHLKDILQEYVDYPLGIIAGTIAGSHLSEKLGHFLIRGINDGRVGIESTKLKGYRDFIAVRESHDNLPNNNHVIKQSINFMQFNVFIHNK